MGQHEPFLLPRTPGILECSLVAYLYCVHLRGSMVCGDGVQGLLHASVGAGGISSFATALESITSAPLPPPVAYPSCHDYGKCILWVHGAASVHLVFFCGGVLALIHLRLLWLVSDRPCMFSPFPAGLNIYSPPPTHKTCFPLTVHGDTRYCCRCHGSVFSRYSPHLV